MLIREMRVKTTLHTHQKSKIVMPCISKNAQQLELSYFAGEHVNSFNPFKNYLVTSVVSGIIHNTPNWKQFTGLSLGE